ncbi:MAG: dienelactone hydrolase family protein [Phenylobacterium sp.]|uniref:dienelactone hydrolase family protein n=1 Tax=Phenylobacterium sp. TaxID=1871053 RepID=UPI00391B92BC
MEPGIIRLYDDFTHGRLNRRAFLERLAALAGGATAATALLSALENDYARAETIAEADPRISAETVAVPGAENLSGYLVRPKGVARAPAVLVIHENRGLNPHIKDVTRRVATEGFVALGLDFLSPMGGTPADQDKGREMIGGLDPADATSYGRAAIAWLGRRPETNGRVGAVGFCWGGGMVNRLAVAEPALDAGVVYYGIQPPLDQVAAVRAPLLLHYAGLDERINAGAEAYGAALKAAGKTVEAHVYPDVNHAFNNDTAGPRYDEAAADLAWGRTIAWFRRHLA